LAAPIYADLRGLAPLFIQVGAAETLLDDALRLAGAAGAADVRVGLEIWPEMIHVWHLFHPALAAGGRAIAEGGAFIRAHLGCRARGGRGRRLRAHNRLMKNQRWGLVRCAAISMTFATVKRLPRAGSFAIFRSPAMPGMVRKSTAFVPRYQKFES